MSLPDKEIWYDWGGANEWLFKEINSIQPGHTYDDIMVLLSNIADHHHFPYYMGGLAIIALLLYLARKIGEKGGARHLVASWLGVFLVLGAGYAAEGYIIPHMKDYCSYPRPYIALPHTTRVLEVRPDDDDYHSFPSGHTAFITLMVAGLWPVLAPQLRWLGSWLIVGVGWSRMALGVHFPADVTLSFLMFLLMVTIVRSIIYRTLRVFNIRC